MSPSNLYVDNPWSFSTSPSSSSNKPPEQLFFETYVQSVDSKIFATGPMTKWYSSHVHFRSETGKAFHSAEEMKTWMVELFFSFERYRHVPEYYLQYTVDENNKTKVHVGFRRQLWIKGNTGEMPDTDTPVAWICRIGKAEEGEDGCFGLQFKEVSLYWDKTRIVGLLGKGLPSD